MDHPRWQRALLLYRQSRSELAEAELRQLLGEAPNDAPAHALLARVLAESERYDEATSEAMLAVHLAPDDAFVYQSLAAVMLRRRRFREAEQAVQEAINIAPEWAHNYALLSQIHLGESRWSDALAAADKGLQLDPQDDDNANLKAIALRQLGRGDEARAVVQASLAQNPENALSHANQGWTLLHQRDPKNALEHFQEALRIDPTDESARAGIVEALKARNFLYRWMLGWFFWMSRLDGRVRWVIILGGYFGFRILRGVARGNPQFAPYLLPLLAAYVGFVILTWISVPLGNLLLRLNRYGRLALGREQVITSNYVGACVLGVLLFGVAGVALWRFSFLQAALVCGLMIPPLGSIYNCDPGWPRKTMMAIAVAMAVLGFGSFLLATAVSFEFGLDEELRAGAARAAEYSFYGFVALAVISQFAANGLSGVTVRK